MKMYLNVNLTPPPPTPGEGVCTTPKTPEILNSLMNLTSRPPLPSSYAHYQVGSDLLSPVSEVSSPGEESAAAPLGGAALSRDSSSSWCFLRPGAPSPPSTPELPSPVSTLQSTKTALIKEGLKLQIRTKLTAAGIPPAEVLNPLSIKEEINDKCLLTEEDEERRRRRRERNKVAATKCRNKKKEKTIVLMSSMLQESESVEDINLRLKNEIQRLSSEKASLEKLLGDPDHRASCRHTPRCPRDPPTVIITGPHSPDASSSSSSCSSSSSSSSSPPLTCPPLSITSSIPGPSKTFHTLSVPTSSCLSSQFLSPKYHPSQSFPQRHHPYLSPGRAALRTRLAPSNLTETCPPTGPSPGPPKHDVMETMENSFTYPMATTSCAPHEFSVPNPPSHKYTAPKSRGDPLPRFNPYGGHAMTTSTSSIVAHQPQGVTDSQENYNTQNSSCGRDDSGYVPDMLTNQFFPPCSYSGM